MDCRNVSPILIIKSLFTVSIALGILGFILIITGSSSRDVGSTTISTPAPIKITRKLETSDLASITKGLWPNGKVPFIIDSAVPNIYVDKINSAIKTLSLKTCIALTQKEDSDENWLNFSFKNVSSSSTCETPKLPGIDISKTGMRKIVIEENCLGVDTLVGHSLGLDFEETRPDRDRFVRYSYEHVCDTYPKRNISSEIPIGHHFESALDISFDYTSVMYRNKLPCLEPKLPGTYKFGSESFSALDIEKLNALYNCPGCKSYRFLPSEKVLDPLNSFESFRPVVGGIEIDGKTSLYICRVYQYGSILIGKVTTYQGARQCWVEDRGREHEYTQFFEILTNPAGANLVWKSSSQSDIPANAIIGGRTSIGVPIYVGRCKLNYYGKETIVTGSINPYLPTFNVPFNRMANPCPLDRQEILVCEE